MDPCPAAVPDRVRDTIEWVFSKNPDKDYLPGEYHIFYRSGADAATASETRKERIAGTLSNIWTEDVREGEGIGGFCAQFDFRHEKPAGQGSSESLREAQIAVAMHARHVVVTREGLPLGESAGNFLLGCLEPGSQGFVFIGKDQRIRACVRRYERLLLINKPLGDCLPVMDLIADDDSQWRVEIGGDGPIPMVAGQVLSEEQMRSLVERLLASII